MNVRKFLPCGMNVCVCVCVCLFCFVLFLLFFVSFCFCFLFCFVFVFCLINNIFGDLLLFQILKKKWDKTVRPISQSMTSLLMCSFNV